jgi:hypothetical protein
MSQHACKVDTFPSFNELSERVYGDPVEMDSPICGRNSLKPVGDREDREIALAQWQAAVRRLRLLAEHADVFTPSVFVKKVDESLRELRKAAMRTISDKKEE